MSTLSIDQWRRNLDAEHDDQKRWLRAARSGEDKRAAEDLNWRLDSAADVKRQEYLIEYLRRHAPPGATLDVLDVGSGPLSHFPKAWLTRTIRVTAVDPLAERHPALLSEFGITPPRAVQAGEAERLSELFDAGSFDVVYCRNALEQTRDPLASIRQMLAMVKPDHFVLLLQDDHRTAEQQQRGPWVLSEDDEELILTGPASFRCDVRDELGELLSDVRVTRSWHWPWLLAALRRK